MGRWLWPRGRKSWFWGKTAEHLLYHHLMKQ